MNFVTETMFINGRKVETGKRTAIHNPAFTNQIIGETAVGSEAHVEEAIDAAHNSWPKWAQVPAHKRAQYLEQTADFIEQNCDRLAHLLVLEHGKVLGEAKADVLGGANVLRYYSSLAGELMADQVIENSQGKLILTRQPMGVVSIIVPWNYPIILGFLMLAPSLLAGNCVVLKPSTFAPLTLTTILKTMASLLPDGVLNVVLGSGSIVGEAMVTHPKVRKISFTGSTEVGMSILRGASGTIKNTSMELGGNDAAIILRDAEINDYLIEGLIKGVFTSSGQICYGVKRIYVSREKYDDFVHQFIYAAGNIRVGFGMDPGTTMGPVNNKPQMDAVNELIKGARRSGEVKTVGSFVEGTSPSDGYYILPTIVTEVKQTDDIVQQEQFGPVIPIIPFDTEEQAIGYANDTEFGLGNSIWTSDVERGFQLGRNLQSGSVFVNVHRLGASAVNMPFGGFKQSGIGRGHGIEGLYEHTELQALIHRTDM